MSVAVGAAAAVSAGASTAGAAVDLSSQVDRVSALFDDALAEDLGAWAIEAVHPVRHGSIAVVMRTPAGERFHVDVLRRDPEGQGPGGIAESGAFSLFVANRGDGSTTTAEDEGRGALLLARYLRRREASLAAAGSPLPELMTHGQRLRAFPDGRFFPRA